MPKLLLTLVNHVTLIVKLVGVQLNMIVIFVFLVSSLTFMKMLLRNVWTHVHTDIMKTLHLDNVPNVTPMLIQFVVIVTVDNMTNVLNVVLVISYGKVNVTKSVQITYMVLMDTVGHVTNIVDNVSEVLGITVPVVMLIDSYTITLVLNLVQPDSMIILILLPLVITIVKLVTPNVKNVLVVKELVVKNVLSQDISITTNVF
jgi:hypothetical protein